MYVEQPTDGCIYIPIFLVFLHLPVTASVYALITLITIITLLSEILDIFHLKIYHVSSTNALRDYYYGLLETVIYDV